MNKEEDTVAQGKKTIRKAVEDGTIVMDVTKNSNRNSDNSEENRNSDGYDRRVYDHRRGHEQFERRSLRATKLLQYK